MRETWYVLEDGAAVDPNEVAPDDRGVLRHKSGAAVDMRGDVPRSRGVEPDEERAKIVKPSAPEAQAREVVADKPKAPARDRQMKPGVAKKPYKTR